MEVTLGDESLEVDVLAGAGLASLPGRSIKRTLQPRYTSHARTGGVGCGCRACAKRAKASTNGEGTAIGNRLVHRGTEGGTEGKDTRSKLGSPSRYKVVGRRPIVVILEREEEMCCRDWRLFATKLETADTSEVTVLNNHAPPLYSAVG